MKKSSEIKNSRFWYLIQATNKVFFAVVDWSTAVGSVAKKATSVAINIGSCQVCFGLSANIFMASYTHLKPEKSQFSKNPASKPESTGWTPPLLGHLRDMMSVRTLPATLNEIEFCTFLS